MTKLASIITRLEERNPLPPLCPKDVWNAGLSKEIQSLSTTDISQTGNVSQLSLQAVKSGLLLWNDDLYSSHTISQSITNDLGSYWHGIMHRREGDFSNAKYWFAQVGNYPTFQPLYEQASKISPLIKKWGEWKPNKFIDEVSYVVKNGLEDTPEGIELRQIEVLETSLLIQYSVTV